jgi:hypothetical protein
LRTESYSVSRALTDFKPSQSATGLTKVPRRSAWTRPGTSLIDSDDPSDIKVKVDVIYSKKRIESRSIWPRSALFGFLTDVGVKHIVMTVEATICKEDGDYFNFPTENKRGCVMEMDLEFQGRKLGQGPPLQKRVGDSGTARLLHSKSNGKKVLQMKQPISVTG